MYIPVRNQWTGTIIAWLPGDQARRLLAAGESAGWRDPRRARATRARNEIEAIRSDIREVARLLAEAESIAGLQSARQWMRTHESDIEGLPGAPQPLRDSEALYARVAQIEARHVDGGDGRHYSTPQERLAYCERQVLGGAPPVWLDVATWAALATVEIDDADGYVLESGARFRTPAEAVAADVLPSLLAT